MANIKLATSTLSIACALLSFVSSSTSAIASKDAIGPSEASRSPRAVDVSASGGLFQLPGSATSIGAGPNFDPVVTGTPAYGPPGNHHIYGWSGSPTGGSFSILYAGAASQVSVGANGTPWVVTAGHQIYRYTSINSAVQLPGAAYQVSAIDSTTCDVISTAPLGPAGSYEILHWDGTSYSPVVGHGLLGPFNAYGIDISVSNYPAAGTVWAVDSTGNLSYYPPNAVGFATGAGFAREVAASKSTGALIVLTSQAVGPAGNYQVDYYNGSSFAPIPGLYAAHIAFGDNAPTGGVIYVIYADTTIHAIYASNAY